jgi:hypothetical protein
MNLQNSQPLSLSTLQSCPLATVNREPLNLYPSKQSAWGCLHQSHQHHRQRPIRAPRLAHRERRRVAIEPQSLGAHIIPYFINRSHSPAHYQNHPTYSNPPQGFAKQEGRPSPLVHHLALRCHAGRSRKPSAKVRLDFEHPLEMEHPRGNPEDFRLQKHRDHPSSTGLIPLQKSARICGQPPLSHVSSPSHSRFHTSVYRHDPIGCEAWLSVNISEHS